MTGPSKNAATTQLRIFSIKKTFDKIFYNYLPGLNLIIFYFAALCRKLNTMFMALLPKSLL